MNVPELYRSLHRQGELLLNEMLSDEEAATVQTKSHNYMLDFERIHASIVHRPESALYLAAIKEYQFALLALSDGQYRHSFMSLRLFFELILAAIQFSAHEIDYYQWKRGSKDINWRSIIDSENGVFSTQFVRAFNPDLAGDAKHFLAMAETVYRECSEYVHGSFVSSSEIPKELKFVKSLFLAWHDRAETMRLVVIFAFVSRHLAGLPDDIKSKVESIVLDVLGHLPAVRAIYASTK
jgi:hypothetical protein